MTIDDAKGYLREHWPSIRSRLLEGTYQPQPVKRVATPEPDGGVRKLGVPCVVDRLVQQALLQVLQEQWDPTFSEHSYGFRPGRSAHQAVAQAQCYSPRVTPTWLTSTSKDFSTESIMIA
ncbi:reverse transcriptase domain-containing protein [Mesorhizobium australafricanum]|uniref:reverse transcriptase domain-containing protein n=1 Tax=Mesorhizobium australafricanum TaxID=3072311 RepID=UPI00322164A9